MSASESVEVTVPPAPARAAMTSVSCGVRTWTRPSDREARSSLDTRLRDQMPAAYDDELVRDALELAHEMARHEHSAPLGGERSHEGADPADAVGIEPVDRLVEEEHRRIAEHAPPRSPAAGSSPARSLPSAGARPRRARRARGPRPRAWTVGGCSSRARGDGCARAFPGASHLRRGARRPREGALAGRGTACRRHEPRRRPARRARGSGASWSTSRRRSARRTP